jgi:hypothetical protein
MSHARRILIITTVLLAGCTSTSLLRRQLEAQKQAYYRLKFDSATTVVAVMHRTVDNNVPSRWAGVVELGGPVESLRGDTVIIEPHYILMLKASHAGDGRIVRYNNKLVLPDLVYVPAGPGVHFELPSEARRRGPSVSSIIVFASVALYFAFGSW